MNDVSLKGIISRRSYFSWIVFFCYFCFPVFDKQWWWYGSLFSDYQSALYIYILTTNIASIRAHLFQCIVQIVLILTNFVGLAGLCCPCTSHTFRDQSAQRSMWYRDWTLLERNTTISLTSSSLVWSSFCMFKGGTEDTKTASTLLWCQLGLISGL